MDSVAVGIGVEPKEREIVGLDVRENNAKMFSVVVRVSVIDTNSGGSNEAR